MEPDIQTKLAILGGEASDEVTDVPATHSIQQGVRHDTGFIYNATREGGGIARLFKVLQTNACRFACTYCFTSCAIKRKRTTFKPDELATTVVALNREKRVDGLFLSSGIGPKSADKILAARRDARLHDLSQLRALGVTAGWAAPCSMAAARRCSWHCGRAYMKERAMQDVSKRHMPPAAAPPEDCGPGGVTGRTGCAARLGESAHPRRRRDRCGAPPAADGRGPATPLIGARGGATDRHLRGQKSEDIGGLVSAPRSLRAELRHQRDLVEHRPFFLDQPAADAKV